MTWTPENIAERNPHLTVEMVAERAVLTQSMLERIKARREEEASLADFFEPSQESDEESALQIVAEDAAKERNEIERRQREADIAERIATNRPTHYTVDYTNQHGRLGMEMPSAEFAADMAKTLLTTPAWGKVTSVTITAQFDGVAQ
ncbi:hypothetical protein V5F77_05195 [Xanthobacter sp. DSM 24535]|uniref:hypothetical protein n=1 Tax=Roseixanthobacter psychrophilus TaxID=3119917 RepID=UPI0037263488